MTAAAAPFPDSRLTDRPDASAFVVPRPGFGRRFALVVDTEEEFDWTAPFDRAHQSVTALAGMAEGQRFFEAAHVRPLYVTDYPVASHPSARDMMARWVADGTADVGAHLHPWVNPPHEEQVSVANSFVGNLPEPLERAKLTALRDLLMQAFGKPPVAYRAGRYGIGPNTAHILGDLGFRLDTSVRSRFDYRAQCGPDFRHMPLRPWRTGPAGSILELPLSTAFLGSLAPLGAHLYPLAERHRLVRGGLSRLGLLDRVPLSPEGVPLPEAVRAVDALLAQGQELLLFSFHSPTLTPGHTLYVRTNDDLRAFYRWWDDMLNHLARVGVAPTHLDEIIAAFA